jgi:hypothetical protein
VPQANTSGEYLDLDLVALQLVLAALPDGTFRRMLSVQLRLGTRQARAAAHKAAWNAGDLDGEVLGRIMTTGVTVSFGSPGSWQHLREVEQMAAILGRVRAHNQAQDERIAELSARVAALEQQGVGN